MKKYIFIISILCFISCEKRTQVDTSNTVVKDQTAELIPDSVRVLDQEVQKLQKDVPVFVEVKHREVISNDTFYYTLFVDKNKIPRILKYQLTDDGGIPEGFAYYFFDKNGRAFADYVPTGMGEDYYQVFLNRDKVILYSKKEGKITSVNECDGLCNTSKRTGAAKAISTYMQFFSGYSYSTPKPPIDSLPDLRTYSDSVALKEHPNNDSKTIKMLKDNTHLKYLGLSNKRDSVNGKAWVWYEVETSKGVKGWVFGHPEYVGDLNDENWGVPADEE